MNRKFKKCISELIIFIFIFSALTTGINAADLKGNPLVTAIPPVIQRNDFAGALGYTFTTTETLEVYALGRPENEGLTADHGVRIWNVSTQELVAEVTITPTSPIKDGFRYEVLATPVTLETLTKYLVASDEEAGGDVWFDSDKRWYDVDVNFDVPSIIFDEGIDFTGGCFGGEAGAIPVNLNTEFVYVLPQIYYELKGAADVQIEEDVTLVTEAPVTVTEPETTTPVTETPAAAQTSDFSMIFAFLILGAAFVSVKKSIKR